MVFSQTSHKTQSTLKVVDLNWLKSNKNQQENDSTGVIAGGNEEMMPSLSAPTASLSEVCKKTPHEYLKVEPSHDSTMFHDTDCEFFQDLVQWCSDPAKEEQVQTIDSKKTSEERANINDTLHTPFSPMGWEAFDANSPTAQSGIFYSTPLGPLSPAAERSVQFQDVISPIALSDPKKMEYQEQFLDFNKMPVVFGDLESVSAVDVNPVQVAGLIDWDYLHHTDNVNTQHTDTHNTMPLIDTEESKFVSVIPRELESNDVIVKEVIFGAGLGVDAARPKGRPALTVDIPARGVGWPADIISTPDIVNCVEQMEEETTSFMPSEPSDWLDEVTEYVSTDLSNIKSSPKVDYEPITPKSESQLESDNDDKSYSSTRKRRRYDSDDSDATYTPYQEPTPRRKYTRRKPEVPIKDMIKALEGSQPVTKAKRGRPPKRRVSTVSSVCSAEDNSSNVSSHESKYRELRDKNNEASKRSRMNRKIKELQMEQVAMDLEERNKHLKIKADILEDMTKRLKDALMTVILQKK